jgi:DNA modification methylase
MSVRILVGDVLARLADLEDGSVHCVVTSPSYWALRSYLPKEHADKGLELGSENTPDEYISSMVLVFRAVWRVLRGDGVLFLNMGDSYAGSFGAQSKREGEGVQAIGLDRFGIAPKNLARNARSIGLKPKDLCMMPQRLAITLQADGWYLRSQIPWLKRNAMPESVTDRPATAVEYVFLLSKSQRYFYDAEAIKKPCSENTNERNALGYQHAYKSQFIGSPTDERHQDGKVIPPTRAAWKTPDGWDTTTGEGGHGSIHKAGREKGHPASWNGSSFDKGKTGEMKHTRGGRKLAKAGSGTKNNESFDAAMAVMPATRNRRNSDWFFESWQGLLADEEGDPLALVVNPQPFKEAHFATFPAGLVEPCILAGTSEKGVCPHCGAPWKRVTEAGLTAHDGETESAYIEGSTANRLALLRQAARERGEEYSNQRKTTGWNPTCKCQAHEPVPATVLDPFFGAGTTGLVSDRLHRNCIGIELNPGYARMAEARIRRESPMFAEVSIEYPREPGQLAAPCAGVVKLELGGTPDSGLSKPPQEIVDLACE